MTDKITIEAGGHSKEQVAYLLMERIAQAEGMELYGSVGGKVTRDWILQTYAECLITVWSPALKHRK